MNELLAKKAIEAALEGRWDDAINLNEEILKYDPNDVDALNRIGRAYFEKNEIRKAKLYFSRVLEIDKFNPIATRMLQKLKGKNKRRQINASDVNPLYFIEEPGKTKVVSLLNLGDPSLILTLNSGDKLNFNFGKHRVSLFAGKDRYVGRLPDDLATRIIRLNKNGYFFEAFVKSADEKKVIIFIKEIKRPKQFNSPSFPVEKKNNEETYY